MRRNLKSDVRNTVQLSEVACKPAALARISVGNPKTGIQLGIKIHDAFSLT